MWVSLRKRAPSQQRDTGEGERGQQPADDQAPRVMHAEASPTAQPETGGKADGTPDRVTIR